VCLFPSLSLSIDVSLVYTGRNNAYMYIQPIRVIYIVCAPCMLCLHIYVQYYWHRRLGDWNTRDEQVSASMSPTQWKCRKCGRGKKVEKYSPFGYLWVSSLNSQAGDQQQYLKKIKNTNIPCSFGVEAKEFFLAAHILLYNSPAWPFRHQLRSRLRQKSPARGGQHGCCSYICQRFFISLRL
jgi:hypothetical protein